MKRQAGPGLALLTVAKENAVGDDAVWISSLYKLAHETATDADLAEMAQVLDQYRRYYGQFKTTPEGKSNVPYPQHKEEPSAPLIGEEKNTFHSTPTMSPPTTPDDHPDELP